MKRIGPFALGPRHGRRGADNRRRPHGRTLSGATTPASQTRRRRPRPSPPAAVGGRRASLPGARAPAGWGAVPPGRALRPRMGRRGRGDRQPRRRHVAWAEFGGAPLPSMWCQNGRYTDFPSLTAATRAGGWSFLSRSVPSLLAGHNGPHLPARSPPTGLKRVPPKPRSPRGRTYGHEGGLSHAHPSVARGIAAFYGAVVISAHTAEAGINIWTSNGPGSPLRHSARHQSDDSEYALRGGVDGWRVQEHRRRQHLEHRQHGPSC